MEMFKDKARFVAVSVFVLDIIVLLIVLILLWTLATRNNNVDRCEIMCIHRTLCGCRTKTLQSYLKEKFDEKFKSLETQRKHEQQQKQLAFRNVYEKMRKMGHTWSIKPIARLSGSKQTMQKDDNDKEMMPLRKWVTKRRRYCYVRNGIGYRNGRLVIPVKGYYHVYSFLDLFLEYSDGNEKTMMTHLKGDASIQHAIFKFNIKNGREDEVLTTYKPYQHSMNGRFNFYETYLSADIMLEAGDEVYLKVSNISYVKNPSKNYFGIHML